MPAVKLPGTKLARKLPGDAPLGGDTCSQLLPPLTTAAVTVYAALALLDVVTATLCPAGAGLPVK